MANFYASYPLSGGGGGVAEYANLAAFPSAVTVGNGALAVALDTDILYISNGTSWIVLANPAYSSPITALTGDGTATGPGSVPLTLATVNSNVGTFGSATQVGTFTVNGKGLMTAASNTSIQITESQVTNLVTDLAGKVPTTRLISTTAPLTGGGDLSADRTIAIPAANTTTNGYLTSADWNTFNGKQASGNYITALTGDVTATGPGSVAATIANLAVTNAKIANSTIDLTTKVTGVLPIANGGTNSNSFTSGKMNFFNGTSVVSAGAVDYSTTTQNVLITASGSAIKPLIVKGAVSQAVNLQEWQSSSATIGSIDQSGNMSLSGTTFNIGDASSGAGEYIQLLANINSYSIVKFQSQSQSAVMYCANAGQQTTGAAFGSTTAGTKTTVGYQGASAGGGTFINFSTNGAATGLHFMHNYGADLFTMTSAGGTTITLAAAAATGLVVKGFTSQSANLQEWQNSSGTPLACINPSGFLGVGVSTLTTSAALEVASTVGAILVPRMTTTQRNALTPANGMMIYNTTTLQFEFYQNGGWVGNTAAAATPSVAGTVTSFVPVVKSGVKTTTNANYAILDADGFDTFLFSTGASNRTLTLPAPANNANRTIKVKKTDNGAGLVTITPNSAETIDGLSTAPLAYQYQAMTLTCDGTNWFILNIERPFYSQSYSAGLDTTTGDRAEFTVAVPYTAIYNVKVSCTLISGSTTNDRSDNILQIKSGATYAGGTLQVQNDGRVGNVTSIGTGFISMSTSWVGQVTSGNNIYMGVSLSNSAGTGSISDFSMTITEISRT